jgi:hypothetical protein
MAKQTMRSGFLGTGGFQKPACKGDVEMIQESIRSHWEKERIENIHDSQTVAEKYGWRMVGPLIEMEIARRKRELQEGTRRSFFNSEREKRANRWLKKVVSSSDPESRIVRLLRETS